MAAGKGKHMTHEEQFADTTMWLASKVVELSVAKAARQVERDPHNLPQVKLTGTVSTRINGVRHVATVCLETKDR